MNNKEQKNEFNKENWIAGFIKTQSKKYYDNYINDLFGAHIMKDIFKIQHDFGLKIDEAHDLFALSLFTGLKCENLRNNLVEGSNDGGIDSWFYDELSEELIFIQSKLRPIKVNEISNMKVFYEKYIYGKSPIDSSVRDTKQMVEEILQIMDDENKKISNVKYVGVCPSHQDDNYDEILSWKKLYKESIENINKKINIVFKAYSQTSRSERSFSENNIYKIEINELLKKINEFNKVSNETLFNANIRGDVSSSKFEYNFTNTLNNEPEKFEIYNNGLTIIANKSKVGAGGSISLINPQIINGQQTMRTLMKISKKIKISEEAYIYAKIIQTEDQKNIMRIAEFSNTQSSIKKGGLISATNSFKELNNRCLKNKYFLEVKDGTSLRKTIYKKMKLKSIKINQLAKIYIADKEPRKMHLAKSSIGEIKIYLMENELLEKIKIKDIKKYYKILKKQEKQIKEFKNENKQKFSKKESKEKNRIWNFCELVHMRMLILNYDKEDIKKAIDSYRDNFSGDSLIQDFKKDLAYRKILKSRW